MEKIEKINLAVLISGSGTNLQALIDACAEPDYPAQISVVISSRPGAFGLERARQSGIPAITIDRKQFAKPADFEKALQQQLENYPVDLICLAGFMLILSPEFVSNWKGRILNTHPSLLPRHGGPGMYGMHVHKSVLESGDSESGASIHIVTDECDAGPVIIQRKVPVYEDDTPENLAARVLEQEHAAYVEAVRRYAMGDVKV